MKKNIILTVLMNLTVFLSAGQRLGLGIGAKPVSPVIRVNPVPQDIAAKVEEQKRKEQDIQDQARRYQQAYNEQIQALINQNQTQANKEAIEQFIKNNPQVTPPPVVAPENQPALPNNSDISLDVEQTRSTLDVLKDKVGFEGMIDILNRSIEQNVKLSIDPTANTFNAKFYSASKPEIIQLTPENTHLFLTTYSGHNNVQPTPPASPTVSPASSTTSLNPSSAVAASPSANTSTSTTQTPNSQPEKGSQTNDKNTESEADPRSKFPYGYPYDKDSKDNTSSGSSGGSSNSGSSASMPDQMRHFDDYSPYYGGYPQASRTGGSASAATARGSVGVSPSQQSGFAITKPYTQQPTYATADQVKKLSSEGKTEVNFAQTSTEEYQENPYERTVSLNAEPLFHTRLTDSTRRLKIAPVSPEKEITPEPMRQVSAPVPVSFFESLWNTITKPFSTVWQWVASFFVRK